MKSKFYFKMLTQFMAAVTLVVGINLQAYAGGGGIPGGYATEYTQILNYLNLINMTIKQAEMISNQINSIQIQIEQLKSIKPLNTSEWGKAMITLRQLDNIVRQGRALSYALQNVEQEFQKRFPGYQSPQDYSQSYQDWSKTTLDSIQGTLVAAGFQSNQFETENSTLDTIRMLSENAEGQTQAIQAANMIANETVGQLQRLRQLSMSQIQAQSAYFAYEVQRDASSKAVSDRFFHEIPYQKSQSQGY